MTKRQELLKKILREELENSGVQGDKNFLRDLHEQLAQQNKVPRPSLATTVIVRKRSIKPVQPARWSKLTGVERATIKGYILDGANVVGWKPYGDDPRMQNVVNNHYGNAVWFGSARNIDRKRVLAEHEKRLEQVLTKVGDTSKNKAVEANPGPDPLNNPQRAELAEVVNSGGFDSETYNYSPGTGPGEEGVPDPIPDGHGGVITPPEEDTVNLEKTAEELREALRSIFRGL